MALKMRDTTALNNTYLQQKEDEYKASIVRVLRFVGEKAVNEARTNKTYQDRTGNLRNSTGYVIVMDGKIIYDNFEANASGDGVTDGIKNGKVTGKNLAVSLAKNFKDIALIVVAGMNYASYVESRGFNVLTSAEQLAKVEVPNLLRQLSSR